MTPEQTLLVQATFALLLPHSAAVAASFYRRLFALCPGVQALFPVDMERQEQKLISMLHLIIAGLHHLDDLLPALETLGARHRAYGATDAHYALVEHVLLTTLQEHLAERWTPEVETAWTAALRLVVTLMQSAPSEQSIVVACGAMAHS